MKQILATLLFVVVSFALATAQIAKQSDHMVPTGKGWAESHDNAPARSTGTATTGPNGINYHGGPLLNSTGGTSVYYIWYGAWSGNTATTILTDLATGIGGTPYFNINTTYFDGNNVAVANRVNYVTSTSDNYSQGKRLTDAKVQTVVFNAINNGKLPRDSNAVYFVLTSKDVAETSGFCTKYCGWHTHGTSSGTDIKYAFVGNPDRCPSACEAQSNSSPNSNPGADGMASVISHELEEAATDPNLNAWYDSSGAENADKCAWTFGTESTAGNGSKYNMTFNGRNWLIQQNWVNAGGGYCAKSY